MSDPKISDVLIALSIDAMSWCDSILCHGGSLPDLRHLTVALGIDATGEPDDIAEDIAHALVALRDRAKRMEGAGVAPDPTDDPYKGRTLMISVDPSATVAEVLRWRGSISAQRDGRAYDYAAYVLGDLGPQLTGRGIAELLAWAEANPGSPLVFRLLDEDEAAEANSPPF